MNILALEPYYGGSHRAFIDGLSNVSKHNWTLLTLPAHKWKWRMRHSAITFAAQAAELTEKRQSWDLLFCSDMLNLAEFIGLAPAEIAGLPKVIYFHENQLTYPVRVEDERDYQLAMTNLTSALTADTVWFNSQFHLDSFLDALAKFLKSMPDYQPLDEIEKIRAKSSIYPPGIKDFHFPTSKARASGPLHILWVARWEHDKNPEDFFEAIKILKDKNVSFRISVIGQSFQGKPAIFDQAHNDFRDHIDFWGYQQSRDDYKRALCQADVVVSTANHEFFGISVVEAVAAGAYPLVPNRLSYPEILGLGRIEGTEQFFYDGTVQNLADKLSQLAASIKKAGFRTAGISSSILTDHYKWYNLASRYDEALEQIRLSYFTGKNHKE
ncbi:MAG: tRNA-queuosine alpha-mannosyltransferase domain-containing protein [Planctomycetota bacterium]|jgi:glycosyltransferase involved in cell wall biosynthesis